ncbi:MAG TPA: efflux RND transporter periplasmic adaptor subunit [Candidatus Kapabacteria bacterium]|nr:efflux RND transporter periplasmic adaptor subunit [Candidatus Kapabacteria bacterium]
MKRKWIIISIVVVAAAAVAFFLLRGGGSGAQKYQTALVERGDLEATVTSTGTITAVGTVEVGTQVSGTIESLLVDFNDKVHKGQLLAKLDTRVLQAAVDDARANLDKAQAQLAQSLDQYNRNKPLYEKKYISAIEFNQYQNNLDAARASVTSAKVALSRARTNLGYAEIRAPTDGTIIERAVESGQTVAASLSAPTIFRIARDLDHMQIEASVDESDIGQIANGQTVHFTVQSQPDRTFTGTVWQIRLQPTTVQNVVNYTVVINAENTQGLLLPGMTATVNFEVNKVTNVLTVPNAALRFQPPPEVLDELRKKAQERGDSSMFGTSGGTNGGSRRSGRKDSTRSGSRGGNTTSVGGAPGGTGAPAGGTKSGRSRLWTLDSAGNLKMIPVRTGLTDGQRTEVSGPNIHEGMAVITNVAVANSASRTGTSALPFGSPAGGRAPTGGGGGGRSGGRGGF